MNIYSTKQMCFIAQDVAYILTTRYRDYMADLAYDDARLYNNIWNCEDGLVLDYVERYEQGKGSITFIITPIAQVDATALHKCITVIDAFLVAQLQYPEVVHDYELDVVLYNKTKKLSIADNPHLQLLIETE